MTGNQNSFGTTSRFNQLSYPRKIGVAAIAVLLGFAIADPGFLSGEAFVGNYTIDQKDDVDSLLAKMDNGSSTSEQPASLSDESVAVTENSPSVFTIPSEESASNSGQAGLVQSVSYPSTISDNGAASVSQQEFPLSLPVTEVPPNGYSDAAASANKTRAAQPVSIRFMGTIYPSN